MAETEESLLNIVNASGFPFQLGIEQKIKDHKFSHGAKWEVLAREHRWADSVKGAEGFIDLIIGADAGRMIIECKKVSAGHWIFLVPEGNLPETRARLLWTHRQTGGKNIYDWSDVNVIPESEESAFCVVRGQSEKEMPMLERLAGILLRSTFNIACEEIGLGNIADDGEVFIYFPVIITNATLQVCRFDPKQIDLSTGQLPTGSFKEVPFVRFRKNLSMSGLAQKRVLDLAAANTENYRTIFIINAVELTNILSNWKLIRRSTGTQEWPWQIARRLGALHQNKL